MTRLRRYGGTVPLLNGMAVANMHLGKFEEAEQNLLDAISKVRGGGAVGR